MIKIGFIGTGNFARQHAEVLKELGANIVACFGTNAEKTNSFARDFQCTPYPMNKEVDDSDWNNISSRTSKKELLWLESTAFINAIQHANHSLIKSTYSDAVKSLMVVLAMNQSAESGQFTTI